MRALLQRIGPGAAGNNAALVRRVEQHFRVMLIGYGPNIGHRMREQVETAANGDQPWLHLPRQFPQRVKIKGVSVGIDRRLVDTQTV